MDAWEAIEENKRLVREWFANVYAKRSNRIDDDIFRQRERLNQRKAGGMPRIKRSNITARLLVGLQ